jgi:hypothetical protein
MQGKKFLFLLIKISVGLGSAALIWWRLRNDLTSENLSMLKSAVFSWRGCACALIAIALIPVNWGIEALKWKIITTPVESLSYTRASRSVYSGVCLGNLAPGRATEFVAKILFFQPENRAKITLLHFANGMIQLSVTILAGLAALLYRLQATMSGAAWLPILAVALSVVVLVAMVLLLFNLNRFMNWFTKRFNTSAEITAFNYPLTVQLFFNLWSWSVLRFSVFTLQFMLILLLFANTPFTLTTLACILLYFFFTTVIPMFSVIEAAVRAAIALAVFNGLGMNETALALASVSIWMVNIIVPSIAGYIFLVQEDFDFKSTVKNLRK